MSKGIRRVFSKSLQIYYKVVKISIFVYKWAEQYYQMSETQRNLIVSSNRNICRICLEEDGDTKLVDPCTCRGSIQYAHINCLTDYLEHKFVNGTRQIRRDMRTEIECEICKHPMPNFTIRAQKKCMSCGQICESINHEDIFFFIVFLLMYIGFHAVGVLIILQEGVLPKVIGAVWLIASIVTFNYAFISIAKTAFYTRKAIVSYKPDPQ